MNPDLDFAQMDITGIGGTARIRIPLNKDGVIDDEELNEYVKLFMTVVEIRGGEADFIDAMRAYERYKRQQTRD